jgi:hypothetical protein
MAMTRRKIINLELNEINFDLVEQYLANGFKLPAFQNLLQTTQKRITFCEDEYTHIEPWVQWVSAHTGKSFSEHGIFRLGDAASETNSSNQQIFETLEERGLKVGALSPMNAVNKMNNPSFFIPDPWTDTESDKSRFSRTFSEMLSQTVNDNTNGRVSLKSYLALFKSLVWSWSHLDKSTMLKCIVSRKKPWYKALVLDTLSVAVFCKLFEKRRPDVAFCFMNAGAHIQHHYLRNSELIEGEKNPSWYCSDEDPIAQMLLVYDFLLRQVFDTAERMNTELIVSTGLSQVPYDKVKFYYRLTDHAAFLNGLGLKFGSVFPRMTRDFEVFFDDINDLEKFVEFCKSATHISSGLKLFGDLDIRKNSVFCSLIFPEEIKSGEKVTSSCGTIEDLSEHVNFVAIKNGMHQAKGFVFASENIELPITEGFHVKELFNINLRNAC